MPGEQAHHELSERDQHQLQEQQRESPRAAEDGDRPHPMTRAEHLMGEIGSASLERFDVSSPR